MLPTSRELLIVMIKSQRESVRTLTLKLGARQSLSVGEINPDLSQLSVNELRSLARRYARVIYDHL